MLDEIRFNKTEAREEFVIVPKIDAKTDQGSRIAKRWSHRGVRICKTVSVTVKEPSTIAEQIATNCGKTAETIAIRCGKTDRTIATTHVKIGKIGQDTTTGVIIGTMIIGTTTGKIIGITCGASIRSTRRCA